MRQQPVTTPKRRQSGGPRRRRWRTGWLVGVLIVAVAGGGAWWRNRAGATSEMAPAFTRPASDGRTISLVDFRGKQPVVLIFYMVAT